MNVLVAFANLKILEPTWWFIPDFTQFTCFSCLGPHNLLGLELKSTLA
jgi:hypothetical protein